MKTLLCVVFFVTLGFSSAFDPSFPFCEDLLEHEIYLNLSGAGITSLKQSFVSSDFIKCLNLASNELSTIEDGAFKGLQSLRALNISSNSINFRQFMMLTAAELTNLETLVVDRAFPLRNEYGYPYSSGYTTDLPPLPWMNFGKLEKLSLSHYGRSNDVQLWLEKFKSIENLTHLRLTDNRLTNLDYLPQILLQGVTHLWLDDNEINTFSGQNVPKVRYLSMNNNKIKKLCAIYCSSYSMSPFSMTELEYLSLVGNEINSMDANVFVNLGNLLSLNLAKNSIDTLPRRVFENTTALEDLRLDNNRFHDVPDLCGLTNLEKLWIDANLIESIDETSFCDLPKLGLISLRNNQLTFVATNTFGNLPMLRVLDISGNRLSQLPPNWMSLNSRLDVLNLERNLFTDILEMSLEQFENIGVLNIGRNPIRSVTVGSLIHLPSNTTLDMNYNGCGNTDLSTTT